MFITSNFFHKMKTMVHDQLKVAFKENMPQIIDFQRFLKENGHTSKEDSFDVCDGKIYCYVTQVCTHRYDEKEEAEFNETFGFLLKNLGDKKFEQSKEDQYSDFLIFEEDQNFAYALYIQESKAIVEMQSLRMKLFCFSANNPHPYFPPLKTLYSNYVNSKCNPIYEVYHSTMDGEFQDMSGSSLNDMSYINEIERFFYDLESSLITMEEENQSVLN
jgi:hypothetical protein